MIAVFRFDRNHKRLYSALTVVGRLLVEGNYASEEITHIRIEQVFCTASLHYSSQSVISSLF